MRTENTINGITWIDLTNPEKKDIEMLLEEHSIDIPSKTILDFETLPQLQTEASVHYCILRFPRVYADKTSEHRTRFEVDCIITDNLLITIHDIPLFEIHTVRKRTLEGGGLLSTPTSSFSLFGILLTEFYTTVRRQLHDITDQLERIELEIYKSFGRSTVEKISKVAKHLIDVERSINTESSMIQQLLNLNTTIKSKNISLASELYNEIISLINTNRLVLDELRKTHQNMIAYNTTNAVRNLSIITFLTLPISVLVNTMNIYFQPNIAQFRTPVLIGIGSITVLLIIYFRQRKWL